ncbi:hypothetical protein RBSWK_02980 [Rhodopirellula baltica SWK14]|uniref:Uncharacterized protein n=1 Tax=Rhodopirellula baltica SWK14 TaxID=993516 RepID=L7CFV4_RHOBT|nr:hypothetical protein RBSWK_02980 [Rhodopirellula baltica SWK14]
MVPNREEFDELFVRLVRLTSRREDQSNRSDKTVLPKALLVGSDRANCLSSSAGMIEQHHVMPFGR